MSIMLFCTPCKRVWAYDHTDLDNHIVKNQMCYEHGLRFNCVGCCEDYSIHFMSKRKDLCMYCEENRE